MTYPGIEHTHTGQTHFQQRVIEVHGEYRSRRLRHEPPDELISDTVTVRTWRPHVVRSGFFVALLVVIWVLAFFVALLAVLVAAGEAASSFADGSSSGAGSSALTSVLFFMFTLELIVFIAWIVALVLPLREPIAEYGLLLEGRAPAGPAAYWWIMNTVRARQTPFTAVLGKVEQVPVLELVNGREHGLVVVRPIGADLYVGWTMWRSRSTMVMIGHLIRDMFQFNLAMRGSDVRAASGRALRELVHSVTREGVQAAIHQPPVTDDLARAQIDQLPSLDLPVAPPRPQAYVPAQHP